MGPRIDTIGPGPAYDPGADVTDTPTDQTATPTAPEANVGPPNTSLPTGPSPLDDPISKAHAQIQLGGGGRQTADTASGVRFNAAAGGTQTQKHEQRLGKLAHYPGEAHQAWKKLSAADRSAVLAKMEARYGKPFAQQFKEAAEKGKSQVELATYSTSPSSKFPMMTAKQLEANGYKKAGDEVTGTAALDVEVWVNPSGKTARLITAERWNTGASQESPATTDSTSSSESPDKVGPAGPVIDGPDLGDKQDKAEHLSARLEDIDRQISALLNSKNIPWDEVAQKFHEANDIYGDLKNLGAWSNDPSNPPALDMNDVDETFCDRLSGVDQHLGDLRGQADDKNPDFETIMQKPYVTETGSSQ